MDTAHWPQEVVKPMEDIISNTCSSSISNNSKEDNINNNGNNKAPSTSLERKVRPQKDHAVNCPRCNSTNTKFCYYNNYSLTQPRYFCKSCRRYWTEGGSLRNIPVGGGSRKNKRSSASFSSAAVKKLSSHELVAAAQSHLNTNPNKIHPHHQDLNLGFPLTQPHEFRSMSEFMQLPTIESNSKGQISLSDSQPGSAIACEDIGTNANHNLHHHMSALELLNGLTASRGMTPFMSIPGPDHHNQHGGVYSSGFPGLQEYKPSLNFTLDGLGNGYSNLQSGVQQGDSGTNSSRLLFPFEDLKQDRSTSGEHNNNDDNSNADNHEQHRDDQGDSTNGYWSGMLGTGGAW